MIIKNNKIIIIKLNINKFYKIIIIKLNINKFYYK